MAPSTSSEEDHENEGSPLLPKAGSESIADTGPFVGCRHVLAFLAFLGFFNVYCLRVNLSVALVAMVNQTTNNTGESECLGNTTKNETASDQVGEFDWSTTLQSTILGSFFYGYIVTQIPGGWLGEKFGGKWLFGLGVLCTSVLTLLTPVAARLTPSSASLLIALRVLEGLGEAVTFPAMHAVWGTWAPELERSKLAAFTYSGAQLGTVVSMPLSGLLCDHGFAGGWPSVFYVFGGVGCLWFFLWTALVYNKPSDHPRITAAERRYIEASAARGPNTAGANKMYTPWGSIFTSMPFWAVFVCHVCHNWGFYTLLTCLPTYMKDVLGFNLSENGLLSGVPYLVMWISMISMGSLADYIRQRRILSTTVTRKIFNTIGLVIPAGFMVATGYVGCDHTLAVVFLTCAVGIQGTDVAGFNVNHLDLAPAYAGTLMGITNTAATIPGFAGPAVVGFLTKHQKTAMQWRKVFFISAGFYVFGALFYLVFGSGEEQPWARPPGDTRSHVQDPTCQEDPTCHGEVKHEPEGSEGVRARSRNGV